MRESVESFSFSSAGVPRQTALTMPKATVFPVIHTAYYYDERFSLNA
jgi:hypothetical protein